ncbi:NADPH-dependent FMN reductase [Streptomyces caelestis]|uniref:NADPH-dependent FMN reductase n=2 Tax=Streptomyces TaxID=1883 RepID=A0A0M9X731_9ACTN|nr:MULTISPECIES: NADPH-dependent FMN reductase [Streptomyces]KOT33973.1 NADPH-dependent FMN reductase [Streptomyces caelestis]KOV23578.1 NADPH-dependent FMN reductase [Streptomyces sp. XY152]
MSHVLVISGSPSPTSRTELVGDYVARRLAEDEWHAGHLKVRDLPAEPLLRADTTDPRIVAALEQVALADGIVLATPTYKASFSGLLKTFLDLLPQHGFTHKVVLPLATGGSTAHVLVLDYALRPVAHSLGARHVVQSFFLLDTHLTRLDGGLDIRPESAGLLDGVIEQFRKALVSRV